MVSATPQSVAEELERCPAVTTAPAPSTAMFKCGFQLHLTDLRPSTKETHSCLLARRCSQRLSCSRRTEGIAGRHQGGGVVHAATRVERAWVQRLTVCDTSLHSCCAFDFNDLPLQQGPASC